MPDFTDYAAAPRYFSGEQPMVPFCFARPDGTCGTMLGTIRATILLDGQHLPGTPLEYGAKSGTVYPNKSLSGNTVDKIFTRCPHPCGETTVARLREVCGPPPVEPPDVVTSCEECGGTGRTECWHCDQEMDCEACDGEGEFGKNEPPPERYMLLLGWKFNTNYLAPLVAGLPDGPVTMFRQLGTTNELVLFVGDGWKLIAISLAGYGDVEPGVEVVDFETGAVTVVGREVTA